MVQGTNPNLKSPFFPNLHSLCDYIRWAQRILGAQSCKGLHFFLNSAPPVQNSLQYVPGSYIMRISLLYSSAAAWDFPSRPSVDKAVFLFPPRYLACIFQFHPFFFNTPSFSYVTRYENMRTLKMLLPLNILDHILTAFIAFRRLVSNDENISNCQQFLQSTF